MDIGEVHRWRQVDVTKMDTLRVDVDRFAACYDRCLTEVYVWRDTGP